MYYSKKCLDSDGDGAINESDLCESLPKIFGGSAETYKPLWLRECKGRKGLVENLVTSLS